MSLTRKRRSTGKVTIADVAQLAGVGTMTVSRALRTPEQVSDKLREKIEAAVQELGYMPNLAASALASASSRTIAMVVPNLAEAGCSAMFAGLQQVLQPAGYQIMLAESQHRLEQEEKLLETLLASNIAAAILLCVEHSDTVRHWLNNASIPVMEMGAMRADPIDMNIGIDNVAAMFELTEMLIHRGYQNIGLLCANQEQWIFQQHLQGWYKAMLRHHMSPNRVINAALPPVFPPALRSYRNFCWRGRSWMRWSASPTSWRAVRCTNASVDVLKSRTIWRSSASAIAMSAGSASRR